MKMLNEMNPKLRKAFGLVALAAALGMGARSATSCSTPNDDPPIEKPKETVTFETLGVADYAESLANAVKKGTKSQLNDIVGYIDLIYKNGFIPVEFNEYNTYEDGQTYIRYIDSSDKIVFYVPESMESDFDQAIAAYKAAHAE